jgi:hypothetical protein
MAQTRSVIDDVIDSGVDEARKLDLGDRLQSHCRHTDCRAGDSSFGDRRIDHSLRTEALLQANRSAKDATVDTDIFAEQYNARIVRHFVGERSIHGFD